VYRLECKGIQKVICKHIFNQATVTLKVIQCITTAFCSRTVGECKIKDVVFCRPLIQIHVQHKLYQTFRPI